MPVRRRLLPKNVALNLESNTSSFSFVDDLSKIAGIIVLFPALLIILSISREMGFFRVFGSEFLMLLSYQDYFTLRLKWSYLLIPLVIATIYLYLVVKAKIIQQLFAIT